MTLQDLRESLEYIEKLADELKEKINLAEALNYQDSDIITDKQITAKVKWLASGLKDIVYQPLRRSHSRDEIKLSSETRFRRLKEQGKESEDLGLEEDHSPVIA